MNAATVALLNRLRGVKRSGDGWSAFCSAHPDAHRSLTVSEDRDVTLITCHTGCPAERVVAAVGLTLANLFAGEAPPPRAPRSLPTTGAYVASRFALPDGTVAEHWRLDSPDGKRMWWTRDGKAGMRGHPLEQLPLYRHEHLDSIALFDGAIVAEGEKAADALAVAMPNYLVLGTVTGAASIPCDDSLRPLVGTPVWLWPDNDAPGRSHMARIAYRLASMGEWPLIIPQISLPAKGGAADAIALGMDLGALLGAAAAWNDGVLPEAEPAQVEHAPELAPTRTARIL